MKTHILYYKMFVLFFVVVSAVVILVVSLSKPNEHFTIYTENAPTGENGILVTYEKKPSKNNENDSMSIIISFSKKAFTAYEHFISLSNEAKKELSKFSINAQFSSPNQNFKLSIIPNQIISQNLASIKWSQQTPIEAIANSSKNSVATISLSDIIKDIEILDTISIPSKAFELIISAEIIV